MKHSQEKYLSGESQKVFVSEKWTIFQSASNLPKIGKTFALPVSFLFSAANADGDTEGLQEAIPKALYMLFEQLEEQNIISVFQMILKSVYIENGTRLVNIEDDFDDLADLIELVAKVLQQQYGALLKGKGLPALFQSIVPLAQTSA